MKVDLTREAYVRQYYESPLCKEFGKLVRTMSDEVKSILEEASSMNVAGEIFIYGLLVEDGIDARTSAEAALAFPNPVHFDGFFNSQLHSDCIFLYELARQYGNSQFDALLQVADSCDGRGILREIYEERRDNFRNFVELRTD